MRKYLLGMSEGMLITIVVLSLLGIFDKELLNQLGLVLLICFICAIYTFTKHNP